MAKRKRLYPATATEHDAGAGTAAPKASVKGWSAPAGSGQSGGRATSAPIASVSADSALTAAFEEVSAELSEARRQGRMVQRLPLEAVDEAHLVRDRIAMSDDDQTALLASLRMRGQQTPVEVIELAPGRYGLISGWRRLSALRQLWSETGEGRFSTVQALIRQPDGASQAYLAMVEENEIRAGLSFYERARIAAQASAQGAFPSSRDAVQGLFASALPAKRSKIIAFLRLYEALDADLRFPSAISEKLGLRLAKALSKDEALAGRVSAALAKAVPGSAEAETTFLDDLLRHAEKTAKPARKAAVGTARVQKAKLGKGLEIEMRKGRCTLRGADVTEALLQDLQDWLRNRL